MQSPSKFGARLEQALGMCRIPVTQAARLSGVPYPTIQALIRRKSDRSAYTESLVAIVPPSAVNIDWLRTGTGNPEPPGGIAPQEADNLFRDAKIPVATVVRHLTLAADNGAPTRGDQPLRTWNYRFRLPDGDWVYVPRMEIQLLATAAHGIVTSLVKEDVQLFRSEWIKEAHLDPSALAYSEMADDSMESLIFKGDFYVIDTSDTALIDGRIYCVYFRGMERARKLSLPPGGGVRVSPLNPKYESFHVPDMDDIAIVGRVVRRSGSGGL